MNIGMRVNGKTEFVLDIPVASLDEACQTWARITGHLDPCWDPKKHTYFGWPVGRTKKKALSRGAVKPMFYY